MKTYKAPPLIEIEYYFDPKPGDDDYDPNAPACYGFELLLAPGVVGLVRRAARSRVDRYRAAGIPVDVEDYDSELAGLKAVPGSLSHDSDPDRAEHIADLLQEYAQHTPADLAALPEVLRYARKSHGEHAGALAQDLKTQLEIAVGVIDLLHDSLIPLLKEQS